jgi:hypothetical protein
VAEVPEKRPRFGESAVYIDGKAVGVIRTAELPAKLKARTITYPGGFETQSYGFVDYARALGVDAKRIKAMHIYGGKRVVVVDRAELTRVGDEIRFSFVGTNRSKLRISWPPVKLNVNTTVDQATNVAFYIEKEPPVLKDGGLVMPDGTPVKEKVPYAPEEQGSGTRVYVDGALVGTLKRKKITNAMAVPEKEDRFSLFSYATMLDPSLNAKQSQVKAMDVVAGDDVVAHVDGANVKTVAFNVPAHNHGQAVVDVSSPAQAGETKAARVSAVQIYLNNPPPVRPVVSVDEASEAALGNGQRQGQGGGGGAGSDEDL